jgi:hypothetical protein
MYLINFPWKKFQISLSIVCWMMAGMVSSLSAQTTDTTHRSPFRFSVQSSVTNNGISLLPTFSLGKPAGIVEMSMGRRFSFDPQYRFSLDGKPWSVIWWFRYKFFDRPRFRLQAGAHPAMIFRSIAIATTGRQTFEAQRYLAAEVAPSWIINRKLTVGLYYLTSRGLKESATRHTHFVTINARVSHLKIGGGMELRFDPQLYFLSMDGNGGWFASTVVTVSHPRSPVYLQSVQNFRLSGMVPGAKPYVWNLSLVHLFSRHYRRES